MVRYRIRKQATGSAISSMPGSSLVGCLWSLMPQVGILLLAHLDGGLTEAIRPFLPSFQAGPDGDLPKYTGADIGVRRGERCEACAACVRIRGCCSHHGDRARLSPVERHPDGMIASRRRFLSALWPLQTFTIFVPTRQAPAAIPSADRG